MSVIQGQRVRGSTWHSVRFSVLIASGRGTGIKLQIAGVVTATSISILSLYRVCLEVNYLLYDTLFRLLWGEVPFHRDT